MRIEGERLYLYRFAWAKDIVEISFASPAESIVTRHKSPVALTYDT